jgi:hypothetical protein
MAWLSRRHPIRAETLNLPRLYLAPIQPYVWMLLFVECGVVQFFAADPKITDGQLIAVSL